MRFCSHCGCQVVRCTMIECRFSGWVHARSRKHQCYPLNFAGFVFRPYAYGGITLKRIRAAFR